MFSCQLQRTERGSVCFPAERRQRALVPRLSARARVCVSVFLQPIVFDDTMLHYSTLQDNQRDTSFEHSDFLLKL